MNQVPNSAQIENLDRMQRDDHDRLVRVEEFVKTISQDIKELKEGTAQRLSALENRTGTLEKRFDQWKTTVKTLRWVVGVLLAAVMFLMANIAGVWGFIRP